MEGRLNIIRSSRYLKWLMKITLVVALTMFDASAILPAYASTVQTRTEIIQSSGKYATRMLSFREAHNRFTRSLFLALQIAKGFVARIFHYGEEVSTRVKIAREEYAMQNVDRQFVHTYRFVLTNCEESPSRTQLKG